MKHRFLVILLLLSFLFFTSSSHVQAACGHVDEPCCATGNSQDPSLSSGYCVEGICTDYDIYNQMDNGLCVDQECGGLNQPCCTPSTGGYVCNVGVCATTGGFGGTCLVAPTSALASPVFCTPGDETSGISTALGCIKVNSGAGLVEAILRFATGIGGGIALALILYGVFIVTTSAGSPDKLKQGQEIITSAIVGLVFILLSVFLINLIGINILGIPGLS